MPRQSMLADKLVVGLGNPGSQYESTWHNLGFRVVKEIASRLKIGFNLANDIRLADGRFAGERVLLAQPMSYMNRSGIPVARIVRKYEISDDRMLVIFDDHDLPRGRLRFRPGGGDGGHRGMKSILTELSGGDIPRLRIGVRDETVDVQAGGYADLADRVLKPLTDCEEKHVQRIAAAAAEATFDWLRNGIRFAMNHHNRRQIPPEKTE